MACRSSQVAPVAPTCRSMIEIGADGERDTAPTLRVLIAAQLDDRARRAVASGVEVGQSDVMGAPVRAVDHGIGRTLQLVVETAIDQPTDDRIVEALAGEHIAGGAALDAAFGQARCMRLMMSPRSPSSRSASRLSGLMTHWPVADLSGEAEDFQGAQPADLQRMEFVGLPIGMRGEVDDAGA